MLELACGTGGITVPLARGRTVVGLDLSASMLAAARRRADEHAVEVEWVQGDMRDFDLGERFSLVFVARNSLLHLHTNDDLHRALACVRRHLADDGVLALDVFVPDVHLLARAPDERKVAFRVPSPDGEVVVEETRAWDPVAQVGRSTWYVQRPGRPERAFDLHLRCLFPQELAVLLESCGFRLVQRHGDVRGAPFGPASRHQVCVCR